MYFQTSPKKTPDVAQLSFQATEPTTKETVAPYNGTMFAYYLGQHDVPPASAIPIMLSFGGMPGDGIKPTAGYTFNAYLLPNGMKAPHDAKPFPVSLSAQIHAGQLSEAAPTYGNTTVTSHHAPGRASFGNAAVPTYAMSQSALGRGLTFHTSHTPTYAVGGATSAVTNSPKYGGDYHHGASVHSPTYGGDYHQVPRGNAPMMPTDGSGMSASVDLLSRHPAGLSSLTGKHASSFDFSTATKGDTNATESKKGEWTPTLGGLASFQKRHEDAVTAASKLVAQSKSKNDVDDKEEEEDDDDKDDSSVEVPLHSAKKMQGSGRYNAIAVEMYDFKSGQVFGTFDSLTQAANCVPGLTIDIIKKYFRGGEQRPFSGNLKFRKVSVENASTKKSAGSKLKQPGKRSVIVKSEKGKKTKEGGKAKNTKNANDLDSAEPKKKRARHSSNSKGMKYDVDDDDDKDDDYLDNDNEVNDSD